MLSTIHSAAIFGIEAVPVVVETDIRKGMPAFHITGQADKNIKEAIERIRSAMMNTQMEYPSRRITVNMSPAGIPKSGSHFDLAIAMGILSASEQVFSVKLERFCFLGELSLSGELMKTDGILPMVSAMKTMGIDHVVVPYSNRKEAMLVRDVYIYPAKNLKEVTDYFNLRGELKSLYNEPLPKLPKAKPTVDFGDVKGQERVKRAISIAVAGGHGLLMMGSPSTGKTMIAERIPTIMPEMCVDEMMETTAIYSIAGLLDEEMPWVKERPFRHPHHKISSAVLLGGGVTPRPGEVTLANKGVLFLDEAGEFSRNLIDCLRTPLEKKKVTMMRCGRYYTFPADFMLVAATNPCKCGYHGDPTHECTCSYSEVLRYQKKLSGPILDRIDMHIRLLPVNYKELTEGQTKTSEEMKTEIENARELQRKRYQDTEISLNSQIYGSLIEEFASLDEEGRKLLASAYDKMNLNPRTVLKVRKLARTIADLENCEDIAFHHIAEALQYRENLL